MQLNFKNNSERVAKLKGSVLHLVRRMYFKVRYFLYTTKNLCIST